MKKIIVAIIVFGMSFIMVAQEEKLIVNKGTFILGGSGQINDSNTERSSFFGGNEESASIVVLNANAGYTVAPNFVLGGVLSYSNFKTNQADSDLLGFGFFAEKYLSLGKKTTFSLKAQGDYSFGKQAEFDFVTGSPDSDSTSDVSDFSLRLIPAISYFITKKIAVRLSLATLTYSILTSKNDFRDTEVRVNNFDFIFNLTNAALGVNFYL